MSLAKTKIYEAKDGHTYVLISLTSNKPTPEGIQRFFDIMEYVRSLKIQVIVVIDTQLAPSIEYLEYLDGFLTHMTNLNGDQVIRCDVYVKPLLGPFMTMILSALQKRLPNGCKKIHIKYFDT